MVMPYESRRGRNEGLGGRVLIALAALACAVVVADPSRAQSLTDGPLAAPGVGKPPPAKAPRAKPTTHASKASAAKARAAKATDAAGVTDGAPADGGPVGSTDAKPVVRRPVAARPSDPLSLGMKWNGSNDNAEQTRIQNYGGTATGTGASVGLNYHF